MPAASTSREFSGFARQAEVRLDRGQPEPFEDLVGDQLGSESRKWPGNKTANTAVTNAARCRHARLGYAGATYLYSARCYTLGIWVPLQNSIQVARSCVVRSGACGRRKQTPFFRSTLESCDREIVTPSRFAISSARRTKVQFRRSATGAESSGSVTRSAASQRSL